MISFVVPAHNEAQLLARTLESIHAAAGALGQPYELIVVDDASSDGTAEIARANGARVIQAQFRQIARARNAGARAACGDTIIFVDADTTVPAATVRAAVDAVQRGAAGGGATVTIEGRLPLWARVLVPLISDGMRLSGLVAGCFLYCRRESFEAAGGFDERLYAAEEIALSRALRRQGPIVTLRETVTTSGRKLRAHSGWEMIRLFAFLAREGTDALRSRKHLAIWYGERRDDPDRDRG